MGPDELEPIVSSPRFATFVDLAAGDRRAAARLYGWTGQLAAALFEDYRCLEIVFRNRVDGALSEHARSVDASNESWLDDSWIPAGANRWNHAASRAIGQARDRAQKRGRPAPRHDEVVAQLGFGFWRYVIHGRYEEAFWLPALDQAFTGVPGHAAVDRRRTLERALIDLLRLRNRIAHHEPICKPTTRLGPGGSPLAADVGDVYEDLLNVLRWTAPRACKEIEQTSRVPELLTRRPA